MGQLRAFSVVGCRCWFYTGDHGPPHFHAGVVDEWEIRVFFMEEPAGYEVKFRIRRIPAKYLKHMLQLAETFREELFREWEQHQID